MKQITSIKPPKVIKVIPYVKNELTNSNQSNSDQLNSINSNQSK
jgi:hypothetical protein